MHSLVVTLDEYSLTFAFDKNYNTTFLDKESRGNRNEGALEKHKVLVAPFFFCLLFSVLSKVLGSMVLW